MVDIAQAEELNCINRGFSQIHADLRKSVVEVKAGSWSLPNNLLDQILLLEFSLAIQTPPNNH
jgi:hypothetical protein